MDVVRLKVGNNGDGARNSRHSCLFRIGLLGLGAVHVWQGREGSSRLNTSHAAHCRKKGWRTPWRPSINRTTAKRSVGGAGCGRAALLRAQQAHIVNPLQFP